MSDILESVNLFNFPLNVIIVDDDIDFLNLLQQQFKDKTVLTVYNSPVDVINNIDPINISTKYFLEEKFIGIQDLNYSNIEAFVKNCKNYHGVLVADYNMPTINGIELLTKYSNSNLIKILLTNIYTANDAINALNKKLINHYLPKEKASIIVEVIREQQKILFSDISKNITNCLESNDLNFLYDKVYINIFNNICKQYKIKKYYIINNYGNYYMENDTQKFIFSIYNRIDLIDISKEVPQDIKYNVEHGYLIPSYFTNQDSNNHKLIDAIKQGNYSYCIEHII
jgi:CheY-like chemotaxis protein